VELYNLEKGLRITGLRFFTERIARIELRQFVFNSSKQISKELRGADLTTKEQ